MIDINSMGFSQVLASKHSMGQLNMPVVIRTGWYRDWTEDQDEEYPVYGSGLNLVLPVNLLNLPHIELKK
jgi:hypothetical protein